MERVRPNSLPSSNVFTARCATRKSPARSHSTDCERGSPSTAFRKSLPHSKNHTLTTMTDHEKAKSHALLILGQEQGPSKKRIWEIARLAIQMVGMTAPKGATVSIDEALLTREL